jgi:hypothetical protein
MNTARESNIKSIAIIAFVSIMLFGIFYYLITDVSNSSDLNASNTKPATEKVGQNLLAGETDTETASKPETAGENKQEVMGESTVASIFKELSQQQMDVKPKAVLGGSDTNQGTQSTVPATGSNTIFGAFVVSSLVMFTGIYLLITQPKNATLAKFEKRIIRDLD